MSTSITCKKAVDYISKKEEGLLTAGMRFQLWRHLMICSLCRIFATQNQIIIKAFNKEPETPKRLNPEEKGQMIRAAFESDH